MGHACKFKHLPISLHANNAMHMWIFLALISSLFLGVYDLFKKHSLSNNAVFPVLLGACISSSLIFIPFSFLSIYHPELTKSIGLYIPSLNLHSHVLIFLKSILVVTSWIFSFFALKHLPLTIVSPIRSTGPMWTLIGAIVIYSEQLTLLQTIGIIITLSSFFLFSTVGKLEGLSFRTNRWMWFIVVGTLLGAASGLYDKFIMQRLDRIAVQAWFTYYQVILLFPVVMIFWYPKRKLAPFQWRTSIPFIGIFLVIADFAYFYALSDPESLISLVSAVRRFGVVIPFLAGAVFYREKNIRIKGLYLAGIVLGVALLLLK